MNGEAFSPRTNKGFVFETNSKEIRTVHCGNLWKTRTTRKLELSFFSRVSRISRFLVAHNPRTLYLCARKSNFPPRWKSIFHLIPRSWKGELQIRIEQLEFWTSNPFHPIRSSQIRIRFHSSLHSKMTLNKGLRLRSSKDAK